MDASPLYDILAFGAHPDDVEVAMGGTCAKLARAGASVLVVDLCDGEPTRYGAPGEREAQARRAAAILGAGRTRLPLQDRCITDTVEARVLVAQLLRAHRPRMVFTTLGAGIHPDHKAVTDIVTNGVFYARLPKWNEVPGGELLAGTSPHEIERLFYAHCRMELPWSHFDFAVDVTNEYETKIAAIRAFESVFGGDHAALLDKYSAEDRYIGSLVGVPYAEAFRARSPLLVVDPGVFMPARFG